MLYATILDGIIPDAAGHLLTASLMNAPAAILMAKLMVPSQAVIDRVQLDIPRSGDESAMDAVARGAIEGASLLINVVAMLTVLVALIHLANVLVGLLPDIDGQPISLQPVSAGSWRPSCGWPACPGPKPSQPENSWASKRC